MSTNLNYKQVTNVSRRTWDVETYEKKAKARQEAEASDEQGKRKNDEPIGQGGGDDSKEEFTPAPQGAAGPEGSQRAFLKARQGKVEIDSKVGSIEIVSTEAVATTQALQDGVGKDGVVKTGIGWHCRVCDCFLKDSHTYLDHINGRKHQRKLGYSMRVERSSKDQLKDKLEQLKKKKQGDQSTDDAQENFDDLVKAKDEEERRRKEERQRKRKERKQRQKEEQAKTTEEEEVEEEEEEDAAEGGIDPAMAAMMGFSGFGGGNKTG